MEKRTLHQFANAGVFGNAKMLRASMTHTEKMLWEELKNKKLGVKFRRQHPLGIYVLDFYCHELGLVIEVDGEYHLRPLQRIDDIEKDQTSQESLSFNSDIKSLVPRYKKLGSRVRGNYNITPIELPFGGNKQSGIGQENSLDDIIKAAIQYYTQLKS